MSDKTLLAHIRREYESKPFNQKDLLDNPIAQFESWFAQWLAAKPLEPTAMILSTVDLFGYPDSRVVLLKDIWQDQFVFFTNYHSQKGLHIDHQPHVALNFYWPDLFRQVRVRGIAAMLPAERSDKYFASRPFESQCSAIVSPQSQKIEDLNHLLEDLQKTQEQYQNQPILRPPYWGGYAVLPLEFEFWQGQRGRFHDRFHYYKLEDVWKIERLAP